MMSEYGLLANDVVMLKNSYELGVTIADSAGYGGHRVGVIQKALVNCVSKSVRLVIVEIIKVNQDEYTAKYNELDLPFSTQAEAVAAFGGIERGLFVVFDDNEVVALLSGQFDDMSFGDEDE